MSDTPSRVLDFALDTFAAETLVGGLQAFACLVTRLWRTLPSTGCFVGRSARFLRKLVVLEGVRSRLCLALALDASREIRVAKRPPACDLLGPPQSIRLLELGLVLCTDGPSAARPRLALACCSACPARTVSPAHCPATAVGAEDPLL